MKSSMLYLIAAVCFLVASLAFTMQAITHGGGWPGAAMTFAVAMAMLAFWLRTRHEPH